MENLLFSKDHMWLEVEGDIAVVGMTEYAAEKMGKANYIELPNSGDFYNKADIVVTLETGSYTTEISCPITGEIIESNELLLEEPDALNNSIYEDGWLFKMHISDESELEEFISYEEYQNYLEEEVL